MSEEQKPPYEAVDSITRAVAEIFAPAPYVSVYIEYDGSGSDAIPRSIMVRLGDCEPVQIPYSAKAYVIMSALAARASRRLIQ